MSKNSLFSLSTPLFPKFSFLNPDIPQKDAPSVVMRSIDNPMNIPTRGRFRYITKNLKPTESPHLHHLPEVAKFGDKVSSHARYPTCPRLRFRWPIQVQQTWFHSASLSHRPEIRTLQSVWLEQWRSSEISLHPRDWSTAEGGYCRKTIFTDQLPYAAGVKGQGNGLGGKSHREQVCVAYGSGKHQWHCISNQQPDEVFVTQLFDSDAERNGLRVAGGVMHSSVHLAGTEAEEARESTEMRCIVIW